MRELLVGGVGAGQAAGQDGRYGQADRYNCPQIRFNVDGFQRVFPTVPHTFPTVLNIFDLFDLRVDTEVPKCKDPQRAEPAGPASLAEWMGRLARPPSPARLAGQPGGLASLASQADPPSD